MALREELSSGHTHYKICCQGDSPFRTLGKQVPIYRHTHYKSWRLQDFHAGILGTLHL
jgi:hypothetical protein